MSQNYYYLKKPISFLITQVLFLGKVFLVQNKSHCKDAFVQGPCRLCDALSLEDTAGIQQHCGVAAGHFSALRWCDACIETQRELLPKIHHCHSGVIPPPTCCNSLTRGHLPYLWIEQGLHLQTWNWHPKHC